MRFSTHQAAARLAAATLALTLYSAHSSAEIEEKAAKACVGQLLIAGEELDAGATSKCKQKEAAALKHGEQDDELTWSVHYLAFLSKASPRDTLSLDFFDSEGKKSDIAAQKNISDVDQKARILRGHVDVTQGDGLEAKKTYRVELSVTEGGKRTVLATGTVKTL